MKRSIVFSLILFTFATAQAAHMGLGSAVAHHDAKVVNTAVEEANAIHLPACTDTPPYTVSPIDLATTFNLDPLGHMSGVGGHMFPTDHIYFYILKSTSATPTYNVYAPGDATIYYVASSQYLHATPVFTDYTVRFSPCQGLIGYFYHVGELSAALQAKIGAINDYCSNYTDGSTYYCNKNVNVPVQAGELIGTITGKAGSSFTVLDLGAYDYNQPALAFISPARQFTDEPYTRCPMEQYEEPIKSMLEARLGKYDGSQLRTDPPTCGEIMQDVANTAQGLWYVPGTPQATVQDVTPHLALVHDNVTTSTGVFSVGTSMSASGLSGGQYYFQTTQAGNVNLDFDLVTPDGNLYCYESSQLINAVILVRLLTATTLKIEKQTAANCAAAAPYSFTGSASTFER